MLGEVYPVSLLCSVGPFNLSNCCLSLVKDLEVGPTGFLDPVLSKAAAKCPPYGPWRAYLRAVHLLACSAL